MCLLFADFLAGVLLSATLLSFSDFRKMNNCIHEVVCVLDASFLHHAI